MARSLTRRVDSRDASGRPPEVPRRIRAAAELLTEQPSKMDYAALAKQLGYRDAASLRKALALPQTVKFLREFKRDLLAKINLGNPEALRKVRDDSDNAMAKVAAVRQLETMEGAMNEQTGGRGAPPAPGVVIIIEQPDGATVRTIGPSPPPMIDVTPESEDEMGTCS